MLRNHAHAIGLAGIIRRVLHRTERGGGRWMDASVAASASHAHEVFTNLHRHTGDLAGKVVLEIGPGDNLGVAYCFLRLGCQKAYAVERFASVVEDDRTGALFSLLDERMTKAGQLAQEEAPLTAAELASRLVHIKGHIESVTLPDRSVDLIVSNDVMEHVDVGPVHAAAFRLLRPGGTMINNIDLAGHNAFSNARRPLDFLSCPDWLWQQMHSHIVTTNRVRLSEFLDVSRRQGFEVVTVEELVRADPEYLAALRPHLLPRYGALPDEDLGVVQCNLVLRRPGPERSGA